jgi:hypothetical protein
MQLNPAFDSDACQRRCAPWRAGQRGRLDTAQRTDELIIMHVAPWLVMLVIAVLSAGQAIAASAPTTLPLTCRYSREDTTFLLKIVYTDRKAGRISAERVGGLSDGWTYQGTIDKVLIRLTRIDGEKPNTKTRINIIRGTGEFEEITETDRGVAPLAQGGVCQKTPDAKF